jgi:predicted nucleic acid-binding protein
MTQVLLFDTNIWSHLVMADKTNSQRVQEQLSQLHSKYPQATIATSRLCVAECLVGARSWPDADKRNQAEEQYQRAFSDASLHLVEVSAQILDHAASLRADSVRRAKVVTTANGGKLKLPDAIVAATCLAFDPPAIFVTENDKDFRYSDGQGTFYTVSDLIIESVG